MKLSPILLSLSISGLSLAQGKGDPPTRPAVTVPFKTILGNPLKINVGADTAFQIFNSAVPGGGQIFPTSSSGLADMGAFLRTGGVLYAPRFTDHDQGTATQNLSPYTPWTLVSESAVTGDGSAGNPFTVTVVVDAGTTGIRMTMVVRYVNGQSYFTQSFLFTGSVARTFDFYFGADLYLAASDYGVPFRESSSGSVGGQECPYPPTYTILFIPFTPADRYVAGYYGDVWYYIGSGQPLPNYIDDACLDNGAALQWRNRSVAPEVGDTIGAATSFGTQNIGPSAVFASPAPGDVAGVVTVTALASTSGGATVTSVRLILDGTTLKTCIASPCTATWEAFRGGLIPHILGAEVKDSAGRVATAQINVSVKPVLSGQLVLSDPSNQSATLPFGATQGAALGVKVSGCTYPVGLTVDDQGWFSSTGREDELARCSGPITATATLVYYDNVLDQQAKPRVTTTSAGSSLIPGRPAVITNLRYKGLLVLIHGIRSSPEKWDVWRDYLLDGYADLA